MLASLGLGAVVGSFTLPRVRARLSSNALLVAASVVYAAVLVTVVLVRNVAVAGIALLPAGFAWIAVISDVNAALQLFLPAWVRARGLSAFLTVLFGSQALGAVLWGGLAERLALVPTFLVAAGVMLVGAVTVRAWRKGGAVAIMQRPQVHYALHAGDGLIQLAPVVAAGAPPALKLSDLSAGIVESLPVTSVKSGV